jgi:hypothetical protein
MATKLHLFGIKPPVEVLWRADIHGEVAESARDAFLGRTHIEVKSYAEVIRNLGNIRQNSSAVPSSHE